MAGFEEPSNQYRDVDMLRMRSGNLTTEGFNPCEEAREWFRTECRILVIGAGGLGCELLKNLALLGFGNIDVVDMDTIDVSNLNRQFLFRASDVGRSKAEVAAAFVNARVRGANVTAHNAKIQDMSDEFYSQFNLVISGLDSVDARRWLNAKLASLVQFDDDGEIEPGTRIPLIDGGTEGFKGQARVFLPFSGACFECAISAFPPQIRVPACTIASKPRKPEHCVLYAMETLWPAAFDRPIDKDAICDVSWVMERAIERGAEFGIGGIDYQLTQGVMKNIIPAIASTNAVVAAACAAEAFKLATGTAPPLKNWAQYIADGGLNVHTFEYARNPSCLVCNRAARKVFRVSRAMRLAEFREMLGDDKSLQLADCSIRYNGATIFLRNMPDTLVNLDKTLGELFEPGVTLTVSSRTLPSGQAASVALEWTDAL
eukprot:Amastigsp_a176762_80.p1 type:complete len:430 gc:universal Amastigsp_a176762_80:1308-19(-)